MPIQDQAAAKEITVMTGGKAVVYERGELLPPPASDEEANTRALLRLGGAVRVVEVVYTPDELAARSQHRGGAAGAAAAGLSAAVVTPPQGADPRQPSAPVVLGPKPPAHGTKRDWVTYATGHGMDAGQAEGLTRDELVHHYRDEPG